jgi:hypothetical protein
MDKSLVSKQDQTKQKHSICLQHIYVASGTTLCSLSISMDLHPLAGSSSWEQWNQFNLVMMDVGPSGLILNRTCPIHVIEWSRGALLEGIH